MKIKINENSVHEISTQYIITEHSSSIFRTLIGIQNRRKVVATFKDKDDAVAFMSYHRIKCYNSFYDKYYTVHGVTTITREVLKDGEYYKDLSARDIIRLKEFNGWGNV